MWTGIPVYKLTEEETQKLLRMEDELHKRVAARRTPSGYRQAIRRTRAGLEGPQAPQRLVHLPGPLRRGQDRYKTLAEFLFGDESAPSSSST